ncbi:unnamed protein product [Brugia pahangi]|uniref:Secreted protein n=1 Tax=Brugia pahangi TaxID=6280 RepID=A0A0N4SYM0_BRUPA|nr:unnamed protein product [Brugia pahangi]
MLVTRIPGILFIILDGSEHNLRLPGCSRSDKNQEPHVFCVVGNRDKTLFVVVTSSIFYIYLANPQLLLCLFKRSDDDVKEKGEYRKVYWRHDSSAICFTVCFSFFFFFFFQKG